VELPAAHAVALRQVHHDANDAAQVSAIIDEGTRLIIQEARSLKRLVDEFSQFARMPSHRPVPADIHKIIDSALLLYEGRLKGVQIIRSYREGLPALQLDPEQMKRLFVNLIDNALAAMSGVHGEKQLTVATRRIEQQNHVRIEVSDTGCGISEVDRDNLFLPYFSRRRKGTGLGLAIVRQIINDHEGRIRCEENRPRGARMIIDLPIGAAVDIQKRLVDGGTARQDIRR
jgi:nitrogen fixation/metabolism regulation signal transduction histidine kinase